MHTGEGQENVVVLTAVGKLAIPRPRRAWAGVAHLAGLPC